MTFVTTLLTPWFISHANNNNKHEKKRCSRSKNSNAATASNCGVATFDRSQIQIGNLLGKGSFCVVYNVRGIKGRYHRCRPKTWNEKEQAMIRQFQTKGSSEDNNNIYAIKLLKKKKKKKKPPTTLAASNKEKQYRATSKLVKEAQLLSTFDHENIVTIHGMGKITGNDAIDCKNDNFFLIIDQLQYTLKDKINQWSYINLLNETNNDNGNTKNDMSSAATPTTSSSSITTILKSVEYKVTIALQIANALDYLHKKRIIYRDLKPENIGFTYSSNNTFTNANTTIIKLFDFGSSRRLPPASVGIQQLEHKRQQSESMENMTKASHTNTNDLFCMSFAGSPMYMAPEVFHGLYNCQADVYSWSIVFYEMLSLTKPYNRNNDRNTHKIGICRLGIRPDLSKLLLASSTQEKKSPTTTVMQIDNSIKNILHQSWLHSTYERFTMEKVCMELQTISSMLSTSSLLSLEDGDEKTKENANNSDHSSTKNDTNDKSNTSDSNQKHITKPPKRECSNISNSTSTISITPNATQRPSELANIIGSGIIGRAA